MANLTLSQMIEGFLLQAEARLSKNTIAEYANTFRKFQLFLEEDLPVHHIDSLLIERFLASQQDLRRKTVLNYHTGLSSLWAWGSDHKFVNTNIIREVRPPRAEKVEIIPFSEQDVKLLLDASSRTRAYLTPGRREVTNALPLADRNKAMLTLFLDTGIRVQEFCDLKLRDVDLRNKYITVFGKGSKERMIPLSPRTAHLLWKYLTAKADAPMSWPAFSTDDGLKLDRANVLKTCNRIGDRAGVMNCHPHRFRHTFAIYFLRNGGDVFTLQRILGHSTLDMVKRYLAIAKADVENAHRMASPVMNWGL